MHNLPTLEVGISTHSTSFGGVDGVLASERMNTFVVSPFEEVV